MELTTEVVVLLACVSPLMRLSLQASFARSFPDLLLLLRFGLMFGALVVVGLIIWMPSLLRPLTMLFAIVSVFFWYRSTEHYGARARLPPGSLSLTRTFRAITEPDFFKESTARHGPIFKFSQLYRPAVCIVGLPRARELLKTHADKLRTAPLPFNESIPGGIYATWNPTPIAITVSRYATRSTPVSSICGGLAFAASSAHK